MKDEFYDILEVITAYVQFWLILQLHAKSMLLFIKLPFFIQLDILVHGDHTFDFFCFY